MVREETTQVNILPCEDFLHQLRGYRRAPRDGNARGRGFRLASACPADVEGMGPNAADARFSDGAKADAEENVGRPKRAIADAGGIEPAVAELVGPGEVWEGGGRGQ